ncbi:MAG: hypothetical protein KBA26_04985, partial [Candidatus Delongbacteria bacterium]|nr:hypothetical protein [Candidatus Delongbacteria bacterium]
QQARLEIIGGVEVIEEELLPNSPCIGRSVKEIAWPRDCVISSIRRGSEIILPHGNTILRQGDVMAFTVEGKAGYEIRKLIAPA